MVLFLIVFSKILAILLVLTSSALLVTSFALSNRSNNGTAHNLRLWSIACFVLAIVWAFSGMKIEEIESKQVTTTHTTVQHR